MLQYVPPHHPGYDVSLGRDAEFVCARISTLHHPLALLQLVDVDGFLSLYMILPCYAVYVSVEFPYFFFGHVGQGLELELEDDRHCWVVYGARVPIPSLRLRVR